MADKRSFITDTLNNSTGQNDQNNYQDTANQSVEDYLRSIDATTKKILESSGKFSQSSARDNANDRRGVFREQYEESVNKQTGKRRQYGSFADELEKAFWDEILGKDFKDQMSSLVDSFAADFGVSIKDVPGKFGATLGKVGIEAFKNSDMGNKVSDAVKGAKAKGAQWVQDKFNQGESKYGRSKFGDTLNNITSSMGAEGSEERAARWAKSQSQAKSEDGKSNAPDIGSAVKDKAREFAKDKAQDAAKDALTSSGKSSGTGFVSDLLKGILNSGSRSTAAAGAAEAAAGAEAAGAAASAAGAGANTMGLATVGAAGTAGAGSAAGAIAGLGAALAPVLPAVLAVVGGLILLDKFTDLVGKSFQKVSKAAKDLKEDFNELKEHIWDSVDRDYQSAKSANEKAKERLNSDISTLVKGPFKILEEAAEDVRSAWSESIRTINQTQGYDKADLQTLMASYADRLRNEGLTDAINASNLTTNLQKVLESGLSGQAAEEFAYVATKLSAAIPTEDFFSYSSTYASLIASNTAAGMSQANAIQYASSQLEQFASNLLYSQRQIANGLSTGLKDASSLFGESVKIVQTARSGDVGQLSSVLTAVSAITGSIAPDLANSITEVISKAATGGNDSSIVALRSLAGGNASNTEFLRNLVNNPQEVFYTLFSNLSKYQKMSDNNFMEVAEGLSDVFGVPMDAFARIDFDYLAKAIKGANKSDAALTENLSLLASGESTTNAEILKNRQINQYIVDEGLSMIIDNDAAMAIQQHMWDEQIALQMQETTYGVEIVGDMKDVWTSLKNTVTKILDFLNPIGWLIKSVNNVVSSVEETNALEADIAQILINGRVGAQIDTTTLSSLTTRGKIQNTTDSLIELLGGISTYDIVSNRRKVRNNMTDLLFGNLLQAGKVISGIQSNIVGAAASAYADAMLNNRSMNSAESKYSWGSVSKSQSSFLQSAFTGIEDLITGTLSGGANSEKTNNKLLQSNFQRFIDSMSDAVDEGKSYDQWKNTAKSFGIKDFDSAIETLGYAAVDLENHFQDIQTVKGTEQKAKEAEEEIAVRQAQLHFYPLGEVFFDDTRTWYDEAREFFNVTSLGSDNHFSIVQSLQMAGNELLLKILNKNTEFKKAFDDYFVNHISYDSEYDASDVRKIQNDESKENSDAIYALADALIASDLKDPTMQTNAILSQILLVVQSIMQQNNTTGKLSLIDSLQAMATGQYQVTNL